MLSFLIFQVFDKTIKLQVKGDPRGLSNKPAHQRHNVGGGTGSKGKTKSMDQSQVALQSYHLGLHNHIKVSYRGLLVACTYTTDLIWDAEKWELCIFQNPYQVETAR